MSIKTPNYYKTCYNCSRFNDCYDVDTSGNIVNCRDFDPSFDLIEELNDIYNSDDRRIKRRIRLTDD